MLCFNVLTHTNTPRELSFTKFLSVTLALRCITVFFLLSSTSRLANQRFIFVPTQSVCLLQTATCYWCVITLNERIVRMYWTELSWAKLMQTKANNSLNARITCDTQFYGIGVHTRRCFPFEMNVRWLRLYVSVCVRVSRNMTTKIAVLSTFNSCARSSFNRVCLCVLVSLCAYLHTAFTTQSVYRYECMVCGMCSRFVRFTTNIYLFKIGSTIRIDILKLISKWRKKEYEITFDMCCKRYMNSHDSLFVYKLKQLLKIFIAFSRK